MNIYRVPVHLTEPPSPNSNPSFLDWKAFGSDLIEVLPDAPAGDEVLEPRLAGYEIVQRVDETTFLVSVVVDPAVSGHAPSAESAGSVVRQALVDLQFTEATARIDTEAIAEVSVEED